MESGDVAWMLISTALVVFMVPGLALFYGGMTRTKNVLNMLMMNMVCIGFVPLLWVLFTYSLGNNGQDGEEQGWFELGGKLIGDFNAAGLDDIAGTDLIGVAFFMTFASITPALISGAVADRMKFSAWVVFAAIWSIIVYTPITYWVYTGFHHTGGLGIDADLPALDFAGGTAIHINAGVAALALVLVLGKRKGWPSEPMPPHNLTMVLLGTGILWFGWFGFNAGSAGAANGQAAQALMNTFVAPAAGMLAWLLVEKIRDGHATTLGAASGIVAGLVAITPAAGYVNTLSSIVFGLVASVLCYFAIQLKTKFGYDDSLDVVGIHGVGGVIGGLLLGLFATDAVEGSVDGLLFGNGKFFLTQVVAMLSVIIYSFFVTFALAKILDAVIGLRVERDDELAGLDLTEHAETAYSNA